MNTLYVNYTKDGTPIADCNVEERVLQNASICVNGQDKEWRVSTENAVVCARMMKMSGKITCDLKIMFEGRLLEMNHYCVIIHGYPYGFCDYVDRWNAELLTHQISLKKRHKDIVMSKKSDNVVKNVGIICVDKDDFLNYRINNNHSPLDGVYTPRKYSFKGVMYWSITSVPDLCSLALDEIVETNWAKRNPYYDEIIYAAQPNLTSNK
jgi:hypothetical protein